MKTFKENFFSKINFRQFIGICFLVSQFLYTFANDCLINSISSPLCKLCSRYTYNLNQLFEYEFDVCTPKLLSNSFNRTIYIKSQRDCNILMNCDGSIENPFDNIIAALFNENIKILLTLNLQINVSLTFKLFSGTHYMIDNDLNKTFTNFFRREPIEISIKPAYCNDLETNKNFCNKPNEKPVIIWKSIYARFYISKNFIIDSIILDFIDLGLNNLNFDFGCKNALQICCQNNCSTEETNSYQILQSKFLNNPHAFFNMEPVFENQTVLIPQLTLNYVEIRNWNLVVGNIYLYSFITYDYFPTKILINNSNFTNVFLFLGILYKRNFLDPLFKNFITTNNILSNIQLDQSEIIIFQTGISFYNLPSSIVIDLDSLNSFFSPMIIGLFDFQGKFTFEKLILSDSKFLKYFYLENTQASKFKINLNNLQLARNNMKTFLTLKNLWSFYDQNFMNCLQINQIDFYSNNFSNFLIGINVPLIVISGIFSKYRLQSQSFIQTEFSNVTLENCFFDHIEIPETTNNKNYYYLVEFLSIYKTSQANAFATIKKSSYYSNDSFQMVNSTFSNCKNLLIIKTNTYGFSILLLNSFFSNLIISTINPFINFIPEYQFNLKNCFFSNISTQTPLISLQSFLKYNLDGLFLENIYALNSDILFFLCQTPYNIDFNNSLKNSFFRNIIVFQNPNLVDPFAIFGHRDLMSGYGGNINISNVYIENIVYNKLFVVIPTVLRLDTILHFSLNVTFVNISDCSGFCHNPRTQNSLLYLSNIIVKSSQNMLRIVSTNDFYTQFVYIINCTFEFGFISDRNAIYIFSTDFLFMENVYMKGAGAGGSFLFVQSATLKEIWINKVIMENTYGSTYGFIAIGTSKKIHNWTEQTSEKSINYSFGILNSYFKNCYNAFAIVILTGSEVYMRNCSFESLLATEGGVLSMNDNSQALFYHVYISNSSSNTSGGVFYSENSLIFLLGVVITDAKSLLSGGIGYFLNSMLIIKYSTFSSLYAEENGGAFILQTTDSFIENSQFFYCSSNKHGGSLYVKEGDLIIKNSQFIFGMASVFGGVFFIENTNLNVNNTKLINNTANEGILFVFGKNTINMNFSNAIFQENYVTLSGLIYAVDMNIECKNCNFFKNKILGNLFEFYGFSFELNFDLYHTVMSENEIFHGILLAETAIVNFETIVFIENSVYSNFLNLYDLILNIKSCQILLKKQKEFSINYFIRSKLSFVSIVDSFFSLELNNGLAFFENCKTVFFSNSIVFQAVGTLGACFFLISSDFTSFNSCYFSNLAQEGGAIYSRGSIINLNKDLFSNNTAKLYASDIEILQENNIGKLNIVECNFSEIFETSIFASKSNISITKSFFKGSSSYNQVLNSENSPDIFISDSNFENFFGNSIIYTIYNYEDGFLLILLENNIFKNSKSNYGGFIQHERNTHLYIRNCSFISGEAQIGGAIYYNCKILDECFFLLENSIFINNSANISGGAIQSQSYSIVLRNNSFLNNMAEIGSDLNYYPSKLKVFFSDDSEILQNFTNNIASQKIPFNLSELNKYLNINKKIILIDTHLELIPGYKFSLAIFLLDDQENLQKTESFSRFTISISNNIVQFSLTNNLAIVNQGIAFFKDMIFSGNIDELLKISLLFMPNDSKYAFLTTLALQVRGCMRGDSYEEQFCGQCPPSKFSLDLVPNADSCHECPKNSFCPGGDLIIPNDNYWRKNENSSTIVKCLSEFACLASSNMKIKVYNCELGFHGNLCSNCDEGYGKRGNDCVKCEDKKLEFIFIFLLYLFLVLIYFDWQERMNSRNQSLDQYLFVLSKILQNHVSSFVIISGFQLNWSHLSSQFITFTDFYITTSPSAIFSYDCFFSVSELDLLKITIIIVGSSPIVLSFLMIVFKFNLNSLLRLFQLYKKQKIVKFELSYQKMLKNHIQVKWLLSQLLKHFIVIYFNFFAQIISKSLSIFGCIEIDDTSNEYVRLFPYLECYDSDHQLLIWISITYLVIWCVITPICLFMFIKKNRESIPTNETSNSEILLVKNFTKNYIIRGYNTTFYFWELIILMRKFFILFLITWSKSLDSISVGGFSILFFFIYLLLNEKYMPFRFQIANNLESFSLLTYIITISLILLSNDESDSIDINIRLFFMTLMFALNILFFCVWLIIYIKKKKENFKTSGSFFSQVFKSRSRLRNITKKTNKKMFYFAENK